MRGFRFGVVLLLALAVLFSDAPMFGARVAPAQEISNAQILRSWDGSGLSISVPSAPLSDSHRTLQKLGGSRLLLQVDASVLRRGILVSTQDEVRRLLREGRIGYTGLTVHDDIVTVRIRNSDDVSRALAVIAGNAEPGKGLSGSVEVRDVGDNVLHLKVVEVELAESLSDALAQSAAIMVRRVHELGLENPTVRQVGPDSIELLLPGLAEPERLVAIMPSMAKLWWRPIRSFEAAQVVESSQPSDAEVLYHHKSRTPYSVSKRIILHSGDVRTARPISDAQTGKPAVGIRLSIAGARRLAQFTSDNVGRPVAIGLDDLVIAAPSIREPIVNGMAKLEGAFSVNEAQELSLFMGAGILPTPLTVVEREIIPPSKP